MGRISKEQSNPHQQKYQPQPPAKNSIHISTSLSSYRPYDNTGKLKSYKNKIPSPLYAGGYYTLS